MMKKKEILEVTQVWIDESKKYKEQMTDLRNRLIKRFEDGNCKDDLSEEKSFTPTTPPGTPPSASSDSKSGYTKLEDFEEMEISSEDDIIPPPSYEDKSSSDEEKIQDESSEEMDVIVLKPFGDYKKK